MQFYFNLTPISIYLLTSTIICTIILISGYCRRIYSIYRFQKRNSNNISTTQQLPPISIIIYCRNNAIHLQQLLPEILNQDYPSTFEIIVVNDGEDEEIKDVVKQFSLSHKNIHTTFTPEDARNVSRKKLSLTLGIKSAKYDIIVTTNAYAHINSPKWLSLIAKNFSQGKDVVIGLATPNTKYDKTKGKYRRNFDIALDNIKYISSAIKKNPYRANSFNLAYRKDLFFKNKGFSHSLNLQYGDDDIFISEIATKNNTAIELHPDSIVEIQTPNYPTIHKELKQRYNFTSKFIKKSRKTKFSFGLYSFLFWLWLISTIAGILYAPQNTIIITSSIIAFLSLWTLTILSWHKAFQTLKLRKLTFTLPYLILTQPIYNFIYKLKTKHSKNRNYTWNQ